MVQDNKVPSDVWAAGAAYEPFIGRWSRPVARELLAWLALPPDRDWLDVGCGTGALTQTILEQADPRHITGVDPSDGFIRFAREQVRDPRVSFLVADAQKLPGPADRYDGVVAGLVLNFVADPQAALTELKRVAAQGGTVAAYVWDYADRMQLLRFFWDAAVALDPRALALDEGKRFPICNPEALDELFRSAGLQEVEVRAIEVPTVFRDFSDYWSPFLGGQGPAPSYTMSLSEAERARLSDRIRDSLPRAANGSIHLVARAWAVRGRK